MSYPVYTYRGSGRSQMPDENNEEQPRTEEEISLAVAKVEKEEHDRQPSDEMSSLAARTLRDPNATPLAKRLAASLLAQDQTKGPNR